MRHTRIRYDVLDKFLNGRLLTSQTVEDFILHLREKNLANVSLNSYIRVIRLLDIFEKEVNGRDLKLMENISSFKKEKRTPVILTYQEISCILSVYIPFANRNGVDASSCYENYNLALRLIAATGCRLNEALTIQKKDVHFGEVPHVLYKNTKTYVDRRTPIPTELAERLYSHCQHKNPDDLVFTTSLGNQIPQQIMEEFWKKCKQKANIQSSPRIHDLRASYITQLYKSGASFAYIQLLVGHEQADTTLGYMKFNYDEVFEAAYVHPQFHKAITPQIVAKHLKAVFDKLVIANDNKECMKLKKKVYSTILSYI